ncbi:TPA_exp: Uracil-DNA glycosylase (UDG) [Trichophyton benhamiae CBS 112371]|nr:TPA_exp: Uracil-DNA glycosylase (UDG) [Trichophyton benhamiae CBS 112371]
MKRAASITSKEAKKPKSTITAFFASSPGSGTAASAAPRAAFDKAKWTSSLTAEQRELLKLEIDTLDESWLAHLTDELLSREFLALKRFLRDEKKSGANIFPPEQDIYSWSRYTPLHKVKAVIIGQDPYHNHGQAHGLCFSVRPPTPAPPSLKNIYLALKNDYPAFEEPANRGGLLTPWAQQGVLLLNTCLTVRAHNANSHSQRGWERFTQRAIDLVARVRTKGVVFLAWGSPAGKRVSGVNKERHCVLQSVHPSPLSAHKGFLTCGHFKKANDWLQTRYGDDGIIDWSLTSKPLITVTSVTTATETVEEDGKSDTVSKTTAEEKSDTISKTATVTTTTTTTDAATDAATSTTTTATTSKSTATKVDDNNNDADSDYGQDLIEDETK